MEGRTLYMNKSLYRNNIKINRIYNNALHEIIGFKVKLKMLICI